MISERIHDCDGFIFTARQRGELIRLLQIDRTVPSLTERAALALVLYVGLDLILCRLRGHQVRSHRRETLHQVCGAGCRTKLPYGIRRQERDVAAGGSRERVGRQIRVLRNGRDSAGPAIGSSRRPSMRPAQRRLISVELEVFCRFTMTLPTVNEAATPAVTK